MHRNTTFLTNTDNEIFLLANSLPLNKIQIDWHSTNLAESLEDAVLANSCKEVEILLAMELDGLITKSQIAQILLETSKLGR